MSLPILTFDERVLSPRFGYVFQRRWLQPYESIVSMLWKFARMNGLPGHAVVMHLCARPIDPYEGIDPSEVDVVWVARLLNIAQKSVRAGLPAAHGHASLHLRYCQRCLSRGYHASVHQQLRHQRCPIHGQLLQTHCPHCGYASAYRLDALMVDAPFRCRHCGTRHGRNVVAPTALAAKERVAITRAALT